MQLRYFVILCGLVIAIAAVVPYSTPPTPSPPEFDFAISVSPPELELYCAEFGIGFVMVAVSTQAINQSTHPVSLTISGPPGPADYSFEPDTGIPSFTSKLIIKPREVPLGKYVVTITGSGGGRTHYTILNLTIKYDPAEEGGG